MASSEGCGRLRLKVTPLSPLRLTSLTFSYQSLRGFLRKVACDTPRSMSQVHLTSLAVKGWPSCHLTPSRSRKVSRVLSAFHDQLVASSGTMVSRLFCGFVWWWMARLLNTPIIGAVGGWGGSPWIEKPAG